MRYVTLHHFGKYWRFHREAFDSVEPLHGYKSINLEQCFEAARRHIVVRKVDGLWRCVIFTTVSWICNFSSYIRPAMRTLTFMLKILFRLKSIRIEQILYQVFQIRFPTKAYYQMFGINWNPTEILLTFFQPDLHCVVLYPSYHMYHRKDRVSMADNGGVFLLLLR